MDGLTEKEKATMKKDRLLQYARQIFVLEMDVVALTSTGSSEVFTEIDNKKSQIESLNKAYAAVEAM